MKKFARSPLVMFGAACTLTGLVVAPPPTAVLYAHYAVASDHPQASEAGASMLAAGGNAADAAVATMLALGVASPQSSGLGGGGFALYYRASTASVHFVDFRERAPSRATSQMFAAGPASSVDGGLAVGVPGEPMGAETLLTRFGSGRLSRGQVAAPAIRLAQRGFTVPPYMSRYSHSLNSARRSEPLMARWLVGAEGVVAGTRLRNPELARTLRAFATRGAQPFYRGEIGNAWVSRAQAAGGVLGREDLHNYAVRNGEVLAQTFGDVTVYVPGLPSSGGVVLLESLALLQRQGVSAVGGDLSTAASLHALTQTWVAGFADREQFLGDAVGQTQVANLQAWQAQPDAVLAPQGVLEASRMHQRALVLQRTQGPVAIETMLETAPTGRAGQADIPSANGTSHFCVLDAEGNMMAITTTVNMPFGSGLASRGVWLNDQMDDFAPPHRGNVVATNGYGLAGSSHNLPAPGRTPLSSMTPTLVLRAGRPWLCLGASGGSRIPTAVTQVLLRVLRAPDLGAAIAAPRLHAQGRPASILMEAGFGTLEAELAARGHVVTRVENNAVVQGLMVTPAGVVAAADPRKGGRPSGR